MFSFLSDDFISFIVAIALIIWYIFIGFKRQKRLKTNQKKSEQNRFTKKKVKQSNENDFGYLIKNFFDFQEPEQVISEQKAYQRQFTPVQSTKPMVIKGDTPLTQKNKSMVASKERNSEKKLPSPNAALYAISSKKLKNAIIWSEILKPPKALE